MRLSASKIQEKSQWQLYCIFKYLQALTNEKFDQKQRNFGKA
jgi:hypothetical protein